MWTRHLLLASGFLTLTSAWKVAGPVCEPFGRASVVAAIDALREGRPICVTDDERCVLSLPLRARDTRGALHALGVCE